MSGIGVQAIESDREARGDHEPFSRAIQYDVPPLPAQEIAVESPSQHSLQLKLAALGPARPLPPPTLPSRPPATPPRLTPEAIVRALAATSTAVENIGDERPPMIIERALVERDMPRSALAARSAPNPWPPLLTGFGMSLLVGCALYWALSV